MDRGVYTAGYRSPDGHEVLIAVDAEGRKLATVVITDPGERRSFIRRTWRILNLADPKPFATGWGELELVDGGCESDRREEL